MVTAVTFGASIDQYAFAEQSSSYTAREFTVKACASLAKNVAVASVSVSACSGVTSEEVNKVLPSSHTLAFKLPRLGNIFLFLAAKSTEE